MVHIIHALLRLSSYGIGGATGAILVPVWDRQYVTYKVYSDGK